MPRGSQASAAAGARVSKRRGRISSDAGKASSLHEPTLAITVDADIVKSSGKAKGGGGGGGSGGAERPTKRPASNSRKATASKRSAPSPTSSLQAPLAVDSFGRNRMRRAAVEARGRFKETSTASADLHIDDDVFREAYQFQFQMVRTLKKARKDLTTACVGTKAPAVSDVRRLCGVALRCKFEIVASLTLGYDQSDVQKLLNRILPDVYGIEDVLAQAVAREPISDGRGAEPSRAAFDAIREPNVGAGKKAFEAFQERMLRKIQERVETSSQKPDPDWGTVGPWATIEESVAKVHKARSSLSDALRPNMACLLACCDNPVPYMRGLVRRTVKKKGVAVEVESWQKLRRIMLPDLAFMLSPQMQTAVTRWCVVAVMRKLRVLNIFDRFDVPLDSLGFDSDEQLASLTDADTFFEKRDSMTSTEELFRCLQREVRVDYKSSSIETAIECRKMTSDEFDAFLRTGAHVYESEASPAGTDDGQAAPFAFDVSEDDESDTGEPKAAAGEKRKPGRPKAKTETEAGDPGMGWLHIEDYLVPGVHTGFQAAMSLASIPRSVTGRAPNVNKPTVRNAELVDEKIRSKLSLMAKDMFERLPVPCAMDTQGVVFSSELLANTLVRDDFGHAAVAEDINIDVADHPIGAVVLQRLTQLLHAKKDEDNDLGDSGDDDFLATGDDEETFSSGSDDDSDVGETVLSPRLRGGSDDEESESDESSDDEDNEEDHRLLFEEAGAVMASKHVPCTIDDIREECRSVGANSASEDLDEEEERSNDGSDAGEDLKGFLEGDDSGDESDNSFLPDGGP